MNKQILALAALLALTGCGPDGGGGGAASSDPAPVVGPTPTPVVVVAPTPTPTPTPAPAAIVIPAPTPNPNQISFSSVSASTIYAQAGASIPLVFTVANPLGNTLTCNWWVEDPPNPGLSFPGTAKHQEGTVNGNCNPWIHNQISQLDKNYWVYISNGQTTLSYSWQVHYQSSAVNNPVGSTAVTPEGTYRVYDNKSFDVLVDDKDLDGTCTWKVDGVLVSSSCNTYQYTQSNGAQHTLVFKIADAISNSSRTWTLKPGAKIATITPTSANLASGATQSYVATLSDPNSTGALCEFKVDGALAQSRGPCTLSYTRTGTLAHTITVDAAYDMGGVEVAGSPLTAYAKLPVNNPVTITSYLPSHTNTMYLAAGEVSNTFGVDAWTDVDGDAWFEWYIGGVKVDCTASALCSYTNPLHNGITVNGPRGVVKVVLTDGQYSDFRNWNTNLDTSTIDPSIPVGYKCARAGETFWIYGTGFDSADTYSLQNTNLTLEKVYVSYSAVQLRVPTAPTVGSQKVRVVKSYNANQTVTGNTGHTTETATGFISFTLAAQYCP